MIEFLGTGPAKPVEGRGKNRRLNSSVYLHDEKILIDVTPNFDEQIKRSGIKEIRHVLVTHAHNDAVGGIPQLVRYLADANIQSVDIYAEPETWSKIRSKFASLSILNYIPIYVGKQFEIGKYKITPFRLIHSIQAGFPTVGYRLNDIVYAEDVGEIPKESGKYFKDASIIIIDAAMWFGRQIKGHLNTEDALKLLAKYKPSIGVLIQAGHTYPSYNEAVKKIRDAWKEIGNKHTKVILSYDGMKLDTNVVKMVKEMEGIYLVRPHGHMIWTGSKKLIVKSKRFDIEGKMLYLIEGNKCYGVIKITKIYPINLKQFEELKDKHKISDEERKEWWPDKHVLFAYEFEVVERFEMPRDVKLPQGVQTFIKDVEFLSEKKLIEDVASYDPAKVPDDILRDDFRIAMAWHATKSRGGKIKYSMEEIENLIQLIMEEMIRRGMKFHPEEMTPHSREVYEKIMKRIESQKIMSLEEDSTLILAKQAFGSPGGKSRIAKKIVRMLPEHKVYVEPFAGGAAVFWEKEPSEVEVLNDKDPEIAFAYRFIQSITPEKIEKLKGMNWNPSKEHFMYLKDEFKPKNDLERFYRFIYLTMHSYGHSRSSFGWKSVPKPSQRYFDRLIGLKERLRNVKIYNKDYADVIREFDSEGTLFYLDPPYPEEWDDRWGDKSGAFTKEDYEQMKSILSNIKGKFVLSTNILPWITDMFKSFSMRKILVPRTLAKDDKPEYEYLITNFDTKKLSEATINNFLSSIPERMTIVTDFVSLVGSTAEHGDGNDIDILIRLDTHEAVEYFKRAIYSQLQKIADSVGVDKDIHVFCEPMGPHGEFLSLYDLVLVRKDINLRLSELKLMHPYLPQKPYGSAFYNIEDLLSELDNNKEYYVEKKFNGFHVSIHKSGDEVKIFSEQKKDITSPFPTLVNHIRKLSEKDFIVDGELVPYKGDKAMGRDPLMKYVGAVKSGKKVDDSDIKVHIWDITYYGKDITSLPLRERKKILEQLHFDGRVTNTPYKLVKGIDNVKKAVEWAANLSGSEGAVIKDADAPYTFGERKRTWLKFRHLVDLHTVVIDKIETKVAGTFNYLVGIYISDEQAKRMHPKYVTAVNGRKVLVLGKTFNTKENVTVGSIIDIMVEDVWRHTYTKQNVLRYSIHKPRFRQARPDLKETSTISDLENVVTSIGEEVVENIELQEEGEEHEVKDFPKRFQSVMRKAMEKKMWLPFVMQHHLRGRSVHTDSRFFVPLKFDNFKDGSTIKYENARYIDGYLEGITLNSPASVDMDIPDKVNNDAKGIRCEMKLPEPKSWLYVEGIFEPPLPGSTKNYPGIFTIVAKGEYRVVAVDDHRFIIEFRTRKGRINKKFLKKAVTMGLPVRDEPNELKQLSGCFEYHIAHIGDHHIILFDRLKRCPDGKTDEKNK